MSWGKISDDFIFNRKVQLASGEARLLYITALCYSANQLTDGHIDARLLQVTGALAGVEDAAALAQELVSVGLWEETEGGYQIHDYHDYNPSAERVREIRAARAEAGRKGGEASRPPDAPNDYEKAKEKQNGSKTEAKEEAEVNPVPVPHDPPNGGAKPTPSPKQPAQRRRSRSKAKDPPPIAVKVFQANAHAYPAKSWYSDIARAVGEAEEDLQFWGQVVKAYVGLGWNPTNVSGMLDFYKRRELPSVQGGNRQNAPPTRTAADVQAAQVRAQR